MFNFLIQFPNFVTNNGDHAIIKSMCKSIYNKFPDSKITVLFNHPKQDALLNSKTKKVYGNLFKIEGRKSHSIFLALEYIFKTIQYLIWIKWKFIPIDVNAKTILNLYKKADLIIFAGGGYLGGRYRNLQHVLIPMYIAKSLGKKIYLSGVTIEPTNKFLVKAILSFVLNRIDLITTRESDSLSVLNSLKIKTKSYLTADYALLLGQNTIDEGWNLLNDNRVQKTDKIKIGLSVKDWVQGFTVPTISKSPRISNDIMVDVIEEILEKFDSIIILFPFAKTPTYDDLLIGKSLLNKVKKIFRDRIFLITNDYQPEQLKSMIGNMDIFIGSRFHSVIFATSMHVPTISISDMQKNQGFMKMLSLENWHLNFSSLTVEELVKTTQKLLNEKKFVKKIIEDNLPKLQDDARKNVDYIEELFTKNFKTN